MKLVLLLTTAFLVGCAGLPAPVIELRAKLLSEAVLDCFPAEMRDAAGMLAFCEASAVVAMDSAIVIASDKPTPAGSPVFQVSMKDWKLVNDPRPLKTPLFLAAEKIEGMTRTPDGLYALATTAFDRVHPKDNRDDGFNALMAWPAKEPSKARLIASSVRDGKESSMGLRNLFSNHLGTPYFKIEGLMALPGNRLVFGVRETGRNYKEFDYRIVIIGIDYRIDADGDWHLDGPFRTLLDFKPPPELGLPAGIGLSSIEYDADSGRIYIATSHEANDKLGAYLWHMTLGDLTEGVSPQLVLGDDGQPFYFNNKAEGIAILGKDRLFVIHDDDRVLGGQHNRKAHQAVYSVVQVQSATSLKRSLRSAGSSVVFR
ncbi:MAG: hypothetical protein Q8M20_11920 [Rhodocyclaceae bacterium]|nr:hypothetical protein [Rhodocyclaceae bacterium]MDZ4214620.1 hypothetical protein [Rhodocyclaceae bacterium]